MKCSLLKWKRDYADELSKALDNKKVQDNLRDGIPFPYTQQDALDFINSMIDADSNDTFAYAISYQGKIIGSIGAFRQGNIHRLTAEMGYYIAEPYWCKGIMSNAVSQLTEFIFKNTDIIRIFAEPFAYNTGSCKVLEHNGFVFEGILRSNALKNGKIIDMRLYSLIKNDIK